MRLYYWIILIAILVGTIYHFTEYNSRRGVSSATIEEYKYLNKKYFISMVVIAIFCAVFCIKALIKA